MDDLAASRDAEKHDRLLRRVESAHRKVQALIDTGLFLGATKTTLRQLDVLVLDLANYALKQPDVVG